MAANVATTAVDNASNTAIIHSGKEFKEYKWYNSHSVPLDVQIGISRLEFPVDLRVGNALDCPKDISITASLVCNQMVINEAPISTQHAVADDFRNALIWDYVMSFPIKLRDIPSNSIIAFTARTPDNKVVGGTTLRLFDDNGLLKRGKQKLTFYFGCEGDKNVIPKYNKTPGNLYDRFSSYDYTFAMEKLMEKYKSMMSHAGSRHHGDQRLDWLDRMTLTQIQQSLSSALSFYDSATINFTSGSTEDRRALNQTSSNETGEADCHAQTASSYNSYLSTGAARIYGLSPEEIDLQNFCSLVVELPQYPHPIIHEDRSYPSKTQSYPPTSIDAIAQGIWDENVENGIMEFSLVNKPFNANSLVVVTDWDIEMENLSEFMHQKINFNSQRGKFDPHIKPNLEDKATIDRILSTTSNHNMSFEDMEFLYKFRYSLIENKRALTKFLTVINWSEEAEVAELPLLLSLWKDKAPIDVADALKLLGQERAYEHPIIREYAVDVLKSSSDEELVMYLLQLVQALRYEPKTVTPSADRVTLTSPSSKLPSLSPSGKSRTDTASSSGSGSGIDDEWGLSSSNLVDANGFPLPRADFSATSSAPAIVVSPLASFLIERGCRSEAVGNFLYWYLKVETEDDGSGSIFQFILSAFLQTLSTIGEDGALKSNKLLAQDEYIAKICLCQRDARGAKGRKDAKEKAMKKLLVDRNLESVSNLTTGSAVSTIPLPLEPLIDVVGINPASTKMFASNVFPAVVDFLEKDSLDNNNEKRKAVSHKIIFKSGDDLRQDQLIMQMIALMDLLLKRVNLDLKLLTYGILAVSQNDGIMEFVSDSFQLSSVLSEYNNNLANFMRHHNPDESGPFGVSAEVFDNYIRSTAGYCVITYILGIGDRHLDNLMLNKKGQLFHIDFGFIFGQDPKFLPPPFRLTRSMVASMGGVDSEHYAKFKSYCYQAYNWLRKSADLIINLLSLMGDAGIKDISIRSSLDKVLMKVEEKFRLDLTDEEAEHYFAALINESLTSIAPKLLEVAHMIAVSMKT